MKTVNLSCLALFLWLLNLSLIPPSFAENAQPWDEMVAERDAQQELATAEDEADSEMSSSVYGRVLSVNKHSKVIFLVPTDDVENPDEEEADNNLAQEYLIHQKTAYTGVDSLNDIHEGDFLTLDYYLFRGQNRVTEIIFDKHSEEETGAAEKSGPKTPDVLVG